MILKVNDYLEDNRFLFDMLVCEVMAIITVLRVEGFSCLSV